MKLDIPYLDLPENTLLALEDVKNPNWIFLEPVDNNRLKYLTKFVVFYSSFGIHFIVYCEDKILSSPYRNDFEDLYKGDVVEIFLMPDELEQVYFEYEISPFGYELPLLVVNNNKSFKGWLPWQYKKNRKVLKEVKNINTDWISSSTIPFDLLEGLISSPPLKGAQWQGNVNRLDYDNGQASKWAWCSNVKGEFHDYKNFGTFKFL